MQIWFSVGLAIKRPEPLFTKTTAYPGAMSLLYCSFSRAKGFFNRAADAPRPRWSAISPGTLHDRRASIRSWLARSTDCVRRSAIGCTLASFDEDRRRQKTCSVPTSILSVSTIGCSTAFHEFNRMVDFYLPVPSHHRDRWPLSPSKARPAKRRAFIGTAGRGGRLRELRRRTCDVLCSSRVFRLSNNWQVYKPAREVAPEGCRTVLEINQHAPPARRLTAEQS